MSHLTMDGEPCGRPDNHNGQHRSLAGYAAQGAGARRRKTAAPERYAQYNVAAHDRRMTDPIRRMLRNAQKRRSYYRQQREAL